MPADTNSLTCSASLTSKSEMGSGDTLGGALRASLAISSASTRRLSSSCDGLPPLGGSMGIGSIAHMWLLSAPPAHPQSSPKLHWLPVWCHPSLLRHPPMAIAVPEGRALTQPPTRPVSCDARKHILHLVLRQGREYTQM